MPRKSTVSDQPSTSRGVTRRTASKRAQINSDDSDSDRNSRPLRKAVDRKPSIATSTRAKNVRKSRQVRSSSEDSDYRTADISQFTQSTKSADKKTQVNNMVKTLLNLSATKYLIKLKGDVEVFKLAKEQLKEIYGLEVSEAEYGSSKGLIVYSALGSGATSLQFPPEARSEITLLFIILAYIFMKGGEVNEGENFLISKNKF